MASRAGMAGMAGRARDASKCICTVPKREEPHRHSHFHEVAVNLFAHPRARPFNKDLIDTHV